MYVSRMVVGMDSRLQNLINPLLKAEPIDLTLTTGNFSAGYKIVKTSLKSSRYASVSVFSLVEYHLCRQYIGLVV